MAKNNDDAFIPEAEKKVRDYLKTLREHSQTKQRAVTIKTRININTKNQANQALNVQHSLLRKLIPTVTGVVATFIVILAVLVPAQLIFGVLFAPLVLVLFLELRARPKKPKQIVIKLIGVLKKNKTPKINTPHPTLFYFGKLIGLLFSINLAFSLVGSFLYNSFLWQTFYPNSFQNILLLLMSLTSTVLIITLKPEKPGERKLYLFLYAAKILALVASVSVVIWSSGWLLYTFFLSLY